MKRWLVGLAAVVLGAAIVSTPGVARADDNAPQPEQSTTGPTRQSGALSGMTLVSNQ